MASGRFRRQRDPPRCRHHEERGGRLFAKNADLRTLLLARKKATEALQRKNRKVITLVFYRGSGTPIKSFYKAGYTACRKAGIPRYRPHDMCRSGARNMIRRGVPQKVSQLLMGRKTPAIFDPYHIIDSADLHDGADLLIGLAGSTAPARVKPKVKLAAVIGPRANRGR